MFGWYEDVDDTLDDFRLLPDPAALFTPIAITQAPRPSSTSSGGSFPTVIVFDEFHAIRVGGSRIQAFTDS
jgi:hypothetical protein